MKVIGNAVVVDRDTMADLVHEALVEAQRNRGVQPRTTWWDAAAAADLILEHVAALTLNTDEREWS